MILDYKKKLPNLKNSFLKVILPFFEIKILLTSLSLGFLGFAIANNFEKLIQKELNRETIFFLICGYFVCLLSLLINALAWRELISWLGYKRDNIKIINLFLRTNLLKYLPGGIWHFIERFRVLSLSIPSERAFSSVLLEPFLMLSAALFLVSISEFPSIISFIFIIPSILLARRWRGPLLMQLAAMKLMQFKKYGSDLSLNKELIFSKNPISPYPINSFLIEIIFLLLKFLAFWFCLKSFQIDSSLGIFRWLSLFSIAWVAGLVVPSAPGGVGVFESVFLLINREPMPQESVLIVLLSYRLLVSISDASIPLFLISNRNK